MPKANRPARPAVMITLWALVLLLVLSPLAAAGSTTPGSATEKLGSVHFETSCSGPSQSAFDRGVALLHSFEFARAIEAFEGTLTADRTCTIAYWAIALGRWGNPFAAGQKSRSQLEAGRQAIAAAGAQPPKTARERAYVAAAAKLYDNYERSPQSERVGAYRDAMGTLASAYPDDDEATIFYALALAFAADPADKTYADQRRAGAMLERLFALHPDHPGLAHYIIHAYDVPPLAERALAAARRYAAIAPSAPHALHMPSHTFTRVGSWQESIDANVASAAAARSEGARSEELHAMDYLTYAYLQTGQDKSAQALIARIPEIAAAFDPNAVSGAAPGTAGLFALAAMPARWALERRDWQTARSLDPGPATLPQAQAMTFFARALGAANTGSLAEARQMTGALAELRDRLAAAGESYWAGQVAIEQEGAEAFVALAAGRTSAALASMREAAAHEDATEKNAVSPGPLVPARELLGEMLLELGRPEEALVQFRATLAREPNRFRTLFGAARAAALAGDRATARGYYARLLGICERADSPGSPELAEARRAVAAAP